MTRNLAITIRPMHVSVGTFAVTAALSLSYLAGAQMPLDTTYRGGIPGQPAQIGRQFESNPLIGSGGLNYARPNTPFLGGNSIATGNVRGGFALRSFSPIPDATAFRGTLGSASLSSFQRDSVSLFDRGPVIGPGGPQAFFDPVRTAPSASYLRGQGAYAPVQPFTPGASLGQGSLNAPGNPLDLRLQANLSEGAALSRNIAGIAGPTQTYTGVTSSMFGAQSPLRSPGLYSYAQRLATQQQARDNPTLEQRPPLAAGPENQRTDIRDLLARPLDIRLKSEDLRLSGRIGEPLRPSVDPTRAGDPTRPTGAAPGTTTLPPLMAAQTPDGKMPSTLVPPAEVEAAARKQRLDELTKLQASAVDPTLLPGSDTFNDMRMALSYQRDPDAIWFKQIEEFMKPKSFEALGGPNAGGPQSADGKPTQGPGGNPLQNASPGEYLSRLTKTPLRDLHGAGRTALNDELLKAESLMEIGQYYEAATRYDFAHTMDRTNPLPLIGKGHAYLAAGDYSSSAKSLVEGLEIFPDLSRFPIDLASLVGGAEILETRRSDLMKRLAQRPDAGLMFLLGYVEYHSGNRELGLAHLDEASKLDLSGSIISRYSRMLRGEGVLPPPKAPGLTPPPILPPGNAAPSVPLEQLLNPSTPPTGGQEGPK